jgi:hypothetical protein
MDPGVKLRSQLGIWKRSWFRNEGKWRIEGLKGWRTITENEGF